MTSFVLFSFVLMTLCVLGQFLPSRHYKSFLKTFNSPAFPLLGSVGLQRTTTTTTKRELLLRVTVPSLMTRSGSEQGHLWLDICDPSSNLMSNRKPGCVCICTWQVMYDILCHSVFSLPCFREINCFSRSCWTPVICFLKGAPPLRLLYL